MSVFRTPDRLAGFGGVTSVRRDSGKISGNLRRPQRFNAAPILCSGSAAAPFVPDWNLPKTAGPTRGGTRLVRPASGYRCAAGASVLLGTRCAA
ncbi:hypothetical protein BIV25_28845 [Streptomyces sp. MUSC 14]|nr:hypothetical protein BIV25_28845 [Streptomyces sp. MUSC 14]